MSSNKEQPAIRNKIYIAGKVFTRDPQQIVLNPVRYEAPNRTSDLGYRMDRPYIYAGQPNVLNSFEVGLTWPTVQEEELLEHLGLLFAMSQPFDVCLFKQTRDIFDGDGVSTDFFIQRRAVAVGTNLPAGIPSFVFADYETRCDLYTDSIGQVPVPTATAQTIVHKLNSNIGTGSPAAGTFWLEDDGHLQGDRTIAKIRLGTAPMDGTDVMAMTYLPLLKMMISQESQRTYQAALTEPRGVKLVEV